MAISNGVAVPTTKIAMVIIPAMTGTMRWADADESGLSCISTQYACLAKCPRQLSARDDYYRMHGNARKMPQRPTNESNAPTKWRMTADTGFTLMERAGSQQFAAARPNKSRQSC
jgi:hypothetical protein